MIQKHLRTAITVGSLAVLTTVARAQLGIIPQPRHEAPAAGRFDLSPKTHLYTEPAAGEAAKALTDRLRVAAGITLAGATTPDADGDITITTQGADASLGDEGYTLDVTPTHVTVRAPHEAGLFYGVQSLLQLLPPAVYGSAAVTAVDWSVPAVHIVDSPRFKWRGLLLDTCRHFETKAEVLRVLDQMAMHKLNVFQWHLTDDQGWRIEIKKYPKLTSVGAWRDAAGFGLDPKLSTTYGPDGRYGGFYTQDDIKEVVAYAAARHITVVPEIEMPGHASAAKRAYPQYFVDTAPPTTHVKGDAGVFNGIYDPANEQTFVFLQDVLTEVIDLFPSTYIHIGGDEVPKEPWQQSPADVAFMHDKHFTSADQLQSYLVQRVGKFIASKGRRMIGWDEILQGGLAPEAAVMSWHVPAKGGLLAARAGHDAVMTQSKFTYLDYEYGRNTELHELGAYLPTQRVYSYEPVPEGLEPQFVNHIIGVQGCLWTEYVPNMSWGEYLLWPRAAALAEVGWTPAADRDFDRFTHALPVEQQRLDAMRVNYRPLIDTQLTTAIHLSGQGGHKIAIDPLPNATIRYSLDSSYPSADAPQYTSPIDLPGGWVQVVARYFQSGKVATPVTAAGFLDGRAVGITADVPKDWDTRQTAFYVPVYRCLKDDNVTIRFLDGPQLLNGIDVDTGDGKSGRTLKLGVLEVEQGGTFTPAAKFDADGAAHATPQGKPVTAIRIRFTGTEIPFPIIRSVRLK